MSGFKGTKGKWVFDDEDVFSVTEDESEIIEFVARNTKPYEEGTNWKDNALLISKAPEMLEMLEKIVDIIDRIHPDIKPIALLAFRMNAKELIKSATEI